MMANYSYDDKGGLFTEASIIKFSQSVYITRVAETLKSIYLKKGITISTDDLRDTFNKFHVDTVFTKRDYINPDQPFNFNHLFLDGFNFLTEKCKQIAKKDLVQGFDEVEFKKRIYSPFLSIYDVSRGKKDVLGFSMEAIAEISCSFALTS